MSHRPFLPQQLSRRRLVGGTAGLAAVALTGGVHAQTPVASPVPGDARQDALVDVEWLARHRNEEHLVLVGLMPEAEFEDGHIGPSFRFDWPDLEVVDTSDAGIAAWEVVVRQRIGDLHVVPESRVVVYDNGTLFAARLWWVLRYLGHADVRVLDGGVPAWRAGGHEIATGPVVMTMEQRPPYPGASDPALLAQRDEVLAAIDDPDAVIVDARAPDEYLEGHIPGAVNVNYPRNAAGDPPRWKSADDLRQMYAGAGVIPDRQVIPYCSSGVRSAVTAYTLWLIGYPRVALYTGSWNEWSALPNAPVATGDRP